MTTTPAASQMNVGPVRAAATSELSEQILTHMLSRLESTPVVDEPYSHFYMEGVFPNDVYQELLQLMPEPTVYKAINLKRNVDTGGKSTRDLLKLDEAGLSAMTDEQQTFWTQVAKALNSPRLQRAMFKTLSTDLAFRFGIPPQNVEQIQAWPKPALFRDMPGYAIAPHPDGRKKIVTMQIYLPKDESQYELGTAVYKRRFHPIKGLFSWRGRFEMVKQFPFMPNSGYAFVVNNTRGLKSWHGRERVPENAAVRNTLLNIYYRDVQSDY